MSAHLAGTYTATLLVMVNVMKGGGRAPPTAPAWANFTLMMECTPESSRCYSVYSVVTHKCTVAHQPPPVPQFPSADAHAGPDTDNLELFL